jgi:hypothetical protein
MLLLDGDEIYRPDVLEKLRAHKLSYVCAYTLRRRWAPLVPLWFKPAGRHAWPREPWTGVPESGKLHELGGSGWGGVLIHRDVAEAVRPLLKGEPFVIEDDMDVWPYDLARVMAAIRGLRTLTTETISLTQETLRRSMEEYTQVLEEEIRPLRILKDHVGSDVRFPFFAREAGYVLMGDPDTRAEHIINYPLNPDDYDGQPPEKMQEMVDEMSKKLRAGRVKFRKAQAEFK